MAGKGKAWRFKPMPVELKQFELDRLFQLAHERGIGESFDLLYETAIHCGLYPRTYRWSIMYTPPANKTRVLLCAWVKPKNGLLSIYIATKAFPEFFPITEREVIEFIGNEGYHSFDLKAAQIFARNLDNLFRKIKNNLG